MATKKAKARETVHDELIGLVKMKPYKAGETFADYSTRLCQLLSPVVDEGDVWNELSDEATTWITAAFKAINDQDEDAIPDLDGAPVEKPEPAPKAKASKGKTKAKTPAPDPDEDDDTSNGEDEDDDPPPPPKSAKGKGKVQPKTKVVVEEDDNEDDDDDPPPPPKKAKLEPKSAKAKAAVVKDDEEDDDDNADEQPKKKAGKLKSRVVEEEDEDGDGDDGDGDDDEPKAKKAKGKAEAVVVRDPSSSKRFRELVVMNHTRNFDRLCRDARKQGIEVADSQLRRIYQSAMEVIKIQVEKGLI